MRLSKRWVERTVSLTLGMFMVGYILIYVTWVQDEFERANRIKRRVSIDSFYKPSATAIKFQQTNHLVRTLRGHRSSEIPRRNVSFTPKLNNITSTLSAKVLNNSIYVNSNNTHDNASLFAQAHLSNFSDAIGTNSFNVSDLNINRLNKLEKKSMVQNGHQERDNAKILSPTTKFVPAARNESRKALRNSEASKKQPTVKPKVKPKVPDLPPLRKESGKVPQTWQKSNVAKKQPTVKPKVKPKLPDSPSLKNESEKAPQTWQKSNVAKRQPTMKPKVKPKIPDSPPLKNESEKAPQTWQKSNVAKRQPTMKPKVKPKLPDSPPLRNEAGKAPQTWQKSDVAKKQPTMKPKVKPKVADLPKHLQQNSMSNNFTTKNKQGLLKHPVEQKSKDTTQLKSVKGDKRKNVNSHKEQSPKGRPEKYVTIAPQKQNKSNLTKIVQEKSASIKLPVNSKQKPKTVTSSPQKQTKSNSTKLVQEKSASKLVVNSEQKPKQTPSRSPPTKQKQQPLANASKSDNKNQLFTNDKEKKILQPPLDQQKVMSNVAPKTQGKAKNTTRSKPTSKPQDLAAKKPQVKAAVANAAPKPKPKEIVPNKLQQKPPQSNIEQKSQIDVVKNNLPPSSKDQHKQSIQKRDTKTQSSTQKPLFQDVPNLDKRTGNYLYDTVILTIVSSTYLDFTTNWLIGMERLGGKSPKIYIIAEDQETYDFFSKRERIEETVFSKMSKILDYVVVLKSPHVKAQAKQLLDTEIYRNLMKPHYTLDFVKRGYDVLYCDVDAMWIQRPYKPLSKKGVDIYMAQSQSEPSILYSGFAMYRPTDATKQFLQRWIAEMDSIKGDKTDEEVLNKLFKNETVIQKPVPKVKLKILDVNNFVPSEYYFDESWREQHQDVKLTTLLLNRIVFRYSKVQRLVEMKKWFISRY